jgi:hypothetical protein
MSLATLDATHPILRCAATIDAALTEVADVQPTYLTTEQKRTALVELSRLEARVAELRLRILGVAGEVGDESGARDVAAWMSHATRADPRAARADGHLARALEAWPLLAAGMRRGEVSAAQARVVADVLDDLPDRLGAQTIKDAEVTLVGYCADFRPRELRRLGRRLLDLVAPEIADAEDAARLEAEERRARETASLRFRDLGDGRTRIWGLLPTTVARRLQHYLQACTSPRGPGAVAPGAAPGAAGATGDGERVPQHRAYAHAFGCLLEAIDPDGLPEHGGDATTVLVTVSLDQLRAELATAGVIAGDGEETISAREARRLACQATIVPAVLGGRGEVLDLGRGRRLFNRAQRRAIRLRDRGCRAEGCTISAAWTEAHHLRPWSEGGPTDLANAISLCSRHHHLVHDRRYTTSRLPGGEVRFHRRT